MRNTDLEMQIFGAHKRGAVTDLGTAPPVNMYEVNVGTCVVKRSLEAQIIDFLFLKTCGRALHAPSLSLTPGSQ